MFDLVIYYILDYEGGYSDRPSDPGGETKWGVTHRLYERVRPNGDWQKFTTEEAREVFKEVFWNDYLEKIEPALQLVFLDTMINHGEGKATRMIQRSLGVARDGIFGPMTFEAAKKRDVPSTIYRILELRKNRMIHSPDASGLINRLLKLQRDSLNLYYGKTSSHFEVSINDRTSDNNDSGGNGDATGIQNGGEDAGCDPEEDEG